ncbi:unnamed protein product [Heligmosomoides polygyrus]|uniref:Uncharacterized protein n=1 Tax=Heligmosomoides polygyrus TaxID=6339 RepID=A0A3P7VYX6_HELPZ|nr:unnamed protein product [Heligmosomoides polygyrus]
MSNSLLLLTGRNQGNSRRMLPAEGKRLLSGGSTRLQFRAVGSENRTGAFRRNPRVLVLRYHGYDKYFGETGHGEDPSQGHADSQAESAC